MIDQHIFNLAVGTLTLLSIWRIEHIKSTLGQSFGGGSGTITKLPTSGGGGTGSTLLKETPQPTADPLVYTVEHEPVFVSEDAATLATPDDYTYDSGEITFVTAPDPAGAVLRSYYNSAAGGTTLSVEIPSGAIDTVNSTYVVTHVPIFFVVNGDSYFEGIGYTRSGFTILLTFAPALNSTIRAVYNATSASSTFKTEAVQGVVNAINDTFVVAHTPLYITLNGKIFFENDGYTRVGLVITMLTIPALGSVLRSAYNT